MCFGIVDRLPHMDVMSGIKDEKADNIKTADDMR